MSLADQGSGMVRERLPGSSSRLTAAVRRPAARELAPLRRAINPAPDQVTAVLPGWSPNRANAIRYARLSCQVGGDGVGGVAVQAVAGVVVSAGRGGGVFGGGGLRA